MRGARYRDSSAGRRLSGLILAALAALALAAASSASFPGANGKVFYEQNVEGTSETDVFSVNPDGGGALDLTAANGYSEERPATSADGQHVAFQSFRDEGWNIFSMNADGSNQVDLTNTKSPVVNFEPTWSPDGTKVTFMRQAGGQQDLWSVDANGANAVNLTQSPGVNETAPEFSPDGTKIVYVSSGPDPCCTTHYNNDIWVMDANGSNQVALTTTDQPTQNIAPTWSPNGLEIAYSTNSTPSGTDDGIHVMNANGTNQHRLLPGGTPVSTNVLAWSPDGAKIAYEGGNGEALYTMNADGSESIPLVEDTSAQYPSWAPVPAPASPPGGSTPPPATPTATPISSKPGNHFSFGKLKLNKKKGTATLVVDVPGAGSLVLGGKGVKKASMQAKGPGKVTLPVKAAAKAKAKLKELGKVKLALKVTFTPAGGAANAESTKVTLKTLPAP